MQREIQILEMALNRGNGSLTINESRDVANAFDGVVKGINQMQAEIDRLSNENKQLKENSSEENKQNVRKQTKK
ncbi:hypothetical protein HX109_15345 [Galbibacter sp. BG1]|uniref:hypothetical protein n=1 Tax=Galbibacter sp. BG1 TaxID=1170699 RepID=UPI0015BD005A|nr:hypothetical protein [Galbibacter sp. BG1]QLE02874.1 hypothetical protein HX109_15345 [Galbibacter sp. BG1]